MASILVLNLVFAIGGVSAFTPVRNGWVSSTSEYATASATASVRVLVKKDSCKPHPHQLQMGVAEAWDAYNMALETDPLITKSVTAGVILGAADLTGQLLENSLANDDEKDIDIARVARFAVFGLILQAPWNHFYYLFLDGALPPTEDPFTAVTFEKVVIDQFVQAPIFTVLIFYFLGLLEGKNNEAIQKQLSDDYKDTMLANWKLWVPATAVNLAFCPPVLRVLFLNCVFFFWSIFLSLKLNKGETVGEDEA